MGQDGIFRMAGWQEIYILLMLHNTGHLVFGEFEPFEFGQRHQVAVTHITALLPWLRR